jgi:hypothetical protein
VSGINASGQLVCTADVGGSAGGDLTDVLQGTGISVSNSAGPQPTVSLDLTYADARYLIRDEASSVSSSMIVNGAVGSADLATNAVTTSAITAGSVTNAKLSLTISEYSATATSSTEVCSGIVNYKFCALSQVSWVNQTSTATNQWCRVAFDGGGQFRVCARAETGRGVTCSMSCF